MRLPILAMTVALAGFVLAGCGGHHHQRSAADWERVLENPGRDAWQQPGAVIAGLALRPDEVVADIGAGTGYFTRRIAPLAKTVYAVDLDPKLHEIIMRAKLPNVVPVLAGPDDPRLPPSAVDTVFICDVLHHIGNRQGYYNHLRRALKPGGRIVVVDFHKRELPVGPPLRMKLADSEVIGELAQAGFKLVRRVDSLPYQYMLEFRL